MKLRHLLTIAVLCLLAGVVWAGEPRVEICHLPPGNPESFHTIRISASALDAHLAHGDLPFSCNALCSNLCDDGDACTVDDTGNCELEGCPVDRQPVDCSDGLNCTVDNCDSAAGCTNVAIVCTPSDQCHISACAEPEGICVETAVSCEEGFECSPDTGECVQTPACADTCGEKGEACCLEASDQCFWDDVDGSCLDREPDECLGTCSGLGTSCCDTRDDCMWYFGEIGFCADPASVPCHELNQAWCSEFPNECRWVGDPGECLTVDEL